LPVAGIFAGSCLAARLVVTTLPIVIAAIAVIVTIAIIATATE